MDSKKKNFRNADPHTSPAPRPIPSELHSFEQGGPFEACSICDTALVGECLYEIQRVYRGKEVVFEMAICKSCGERLTSEFSSESMEALKGFLNSEFKPFAGTTHCHFCSSSKPLGTGYTVIGACKGRALHLPAVVLCDGCNERLQSRLSQKTRESQEKFIRDSFPGIPADVSFNPTLGAVC